MWRQNLFASMLVIMLSATSISASPVNRNRKQERSTWDSVIAYLTRNWMQIAGTAAVVACIYYITRERVPAPLAVGAALGGGGRIEPGNVRARRLEWAKTLTSQTKVEGAKPPRPVNPGAGASVSGVHSTEAVLARPKEASRTAVVETFKVLATALRKCQLEAKSEEETRAAREQLAYHLLIDVEAQAGAIQEIVKLPEFWDLFVQDGHLVIEKLSSSDFASALQFLVEQPKEKAEACLAKLEADLERLFANVRDGVDANSLALKWRSLAEAKAALIR